MPRRFLLVVHYLANLPCRVCKFADQGAVVTMSKQRRHYSVLNVSRCSVGGPLLSWIIDPVQAAGSNIMRKKNAAKSLY